MDGNRHVRMDEVERILGVSKNHSVPDAGLDNISAQPQAPSGGEINKFLNNISYSESISLRAFEFFLNVLLDLVN